jgi:3'-5' exoribonuclease
LKAKNLFLKDIKQGDLVSSSFLVAEKTMAFSQKGAPYLSVRLKDKTGEMDGKIWENAPELDKQFKRGDIVHIEGRATSYKNALQINVSDIQTIPVEETEPADYLPSAQQDPDAMFHDLMEFVDKMENKQLRALLLCFFEDEKITDLFKKAPAAKGFHHIYLGGLLEHTLSVVRLLEMASGHYSELNKDLLITGGILHDIGKIYEFSFNQIIDYTDEGRLIGHIVMGVEMVDKKIATIENFPSHLALQLRHIILSHHGEFEFGSPKRPKTLEALVVHYIDDMDAKFNAFKTFMKDASDKDSDWTPYNRLLERYLYKKRADEKNFPEQ